MPQKAHHLRQFSFAGGDFPAIFAAVWDFPNFPRPTKIRADFPPQKEIVPNSSRFARRSTPPPSIECHAEKSEPFPNRLDSSGLGSVRNRTAAPFETLALRAPAFDAAQGRRDAPYGRSSAARSTRPARFNAASLPALSKAEGKHAGGEFPNTA